MRPAPPSAPGFLIVSIVTCSLLPIPLWSPPAAAQEESQVVLDDGGGAGGTTGGGSSGGAQLQKLPVDQNDVAPPLAGLDRLSPRTGAYVFSIPVSLPPGINGLAPSVSVDYSSDGPPDGIAGAGFTLSVTDCIERRGPARTTELQGATFPHGLPTFSDSDLFYLDGERLILCDDQTGGPTASCPAGTYRKRGNDFVKIVKDTAQKRFVAYRRDGSVAEYAAAVKVWRLYESVPDTFDNYTRFCVSRITKDGNAIDYTYQDNLRYSTAYSKDIQSIDYGGQSPANHKWRVLFTYQDRPPADAREVYDSGGYVWQSKRLASIDVLTLPALTRLRRLVLTYDASPDTRRSRLTQVQEFGMHDYDSLPPYVFSYPPAATGWSGPEWQTGTNGLSGANVFTDFDPNIVYPGDSQRGAQWPVGTSVADLNGDGLPDLIRHDAQLSSKVYLNNPAAPGTWTEDPTWSARFNAIPLFFNGFLPSNIDQGVRLVDLNGDGHVDVVRASHSPTPESTLDVYGVWLWDPSLNSGAGGFNAALGAGFRQALQDNHITFNFLASWPNLSVAGVTQLNSGTVLTDVNGDGLPDIFISREATGFDGYPPTDPRYNHWTTRREVWLNTGTTFVPAPAGTFVVPQDVFNDGEYCYFGKNGYGQWPRDMGVRFGDFNGDGLPDIVQILLDYNEQPPPEGPYQLRVRFWLNNGKGWEQNWQMEQALLNRVAPLDRFWLSHVMYDTSGPSPNWITTNLGLEIVDIDSDGIDDFVQRVCYDGAPPVVPSDCTSQWRSLITQFDQDANNQRLAWPQANAWLLPYYTMRFRSAAEGENLVDLEDGFRFVDFDRDGAIDLFANKIYAGVQSALTKPSRVRFDRDRITGVLNPYGGQLAIQYALSDGPGRGTALSSSPHLPMPKVVVGSLVYSNGRSGGDAFGQVTRTRAFHYFGGRYDTVEREFAGFRAVTEADTLSGPTSYVTTWFTNGAGDRCHDGAVDAVVTSEAMCAPGSTNCFIGTDAQGFAPILGSAAIQANRILKVAQNGYPVCSPSEVRGPFFAPVASTVKSEYDPAQPALALASSQRFYYDGFGNQVNVLDYLKPTDAHWFRAHWAYYFQPAAGSVWMPDHVCQQGLIDYVNGTSRAVKADYFYYDGNDASICQIGAAGKPTRIEKTSWDLATGMEDDSIDERMTYTAAGNVATRTDGRGKVWRTDWNSTFPEIVPAALIDPLGRSTTFAYDLDAGPMTTVDPGGVRSETRYDGLRRKVESWDVGPVAGIGNRRLWSYYLTGDPYGQTVSTSLDFDAGIYLEELDYLDGFGKPYLEVHYGNEDYYLISNLFDALGRSRIRTRAWQPSNGFTFDIDRPRDEHRFDSIGREIETITPGGYDTTRTYTIRQNEQGLIQRLETETLQGAGGFFRRRFVMRDSWNRLAAVAECSQGACAAPSAGAPGVQITTYAYDSLDDLTDIFLSDGRSRVKNFYDGFGRLTAVKDPDFSNCADAAVDDPSSGCPRRYAYDENGNLVGETDARYALQPVTGAAISYQYDDLNRLIQKSVATGWEYVVNYRYAYDQDLCGAGGAFVGRLASESYQGYFESSQRSTCYDGLGRIASVATTVTEPGLATPGPQLVSYGYTPGGSVRTVTLPDGEVLTYGFDDFARVKSLASSVAGSVIPLVTYNLHGQRNVVNYGNGYMTDYEYRLSDYRYPAGDMRLDNIYLGFWNGGLLYGVNDTFYDYDPSGNVRVIYDEDFSSPQFPDYQEFGYDQLDRLTSYYLDDGQKQTFAYDALGGFTQRRTLPADPTYLSFGGAYGGVAGPHAALCEGGSASDPCAAGARTFHYDANGNLSSDSNPAAGGTTSYSYDLENRLKGASQPNGNDVSYVYGPRGELIADWNGGHGTIYVNPAYEIRDGVPVRNYRIDGQVMARREGNAPAVYLIPDHLGSINLVTDANAQTVSQRAYYPYGALLASAGGDDTRLGFNGKIEDVTGLYYYGARHYNPDLGRFLQPDSTVADVLNPQTFNRYAYSLDNPVTLVDPTGHSAEDFDARNGQPPSDDDRDQDPFSDQNLRVERLMRRMDVDRKFANPDTLKLAEDAVSVTKRVDKDGRVILAYTLKDGRILLVPDPEELSKYGDRVGGKLGQLARDKAIDAARDRVRQRLIEALEKQGGREVSEKVGWLLLAGDIAKIFMEEDPRFKQWFNRTMYAPLGAPPPVGPAPADALRVQVNVPSAARPADGPEHFLINGSRNEKP